MCKASGYQLCSTMFNMHGLWEWTFARSIFYIELLRRNLKLPTVGLLWEHLGLKARQGDYLSPPLRKLLHFDRTYRAKGTLPGKQVLEQETWCSTRHVIPMCCGARIYSLILSIPTQYGPVIWLQAGYNLGSCKKTLNAQINGIEQDVPPSVWDTKPEFYRRLIHIDFFFGL